MDLFAELFPDECFYLIIPGQSIAFMYKQYVVDA